MKWEVCLKGNIRSGLELSVIRSDYRLGFESWGWFDPLRKIAIARASAGVRSLEELTKAQRIARLIADALSAADEGE